MDTALLTACIPGALLIAGILYFFWRTAHPGQYHAFCRTAGRSQVKGTTPEAPVQGFALAFFVLAALLALFNAFPRCVTMMTTAGFANTRRSV